jgi:hypothetical protein
MRPDAGAEQQRRQQWLQDRVRGVGMASQVAKLR